MSAFHAKPDLSAFVRIDEPYCTNDGTLSEVAWGRFAYAQRMSVYRLQYVDPFSGNILQTRDFEALTDEAAITYAEGARRLAPMELWNADRKIKQWDGFPPLQ
jgi:hypothetical protein